MFRSEFIQQKPKLTQSLDQTQLAEYDIYPLSNWFFKKKHMEKTKKIGTSVKQISVQSK